MSLTSTHAKRREGAEPEDKSPNSLMREGREERGEGGGGEGEEDGEVRSMTSHGSIHSLLGTTCTPVHIHVGLGSTGTHGAPSRFPQSLFLSWNSSHSFCSAALAAFIVGQLGRVCPGPQL